MTEVALAFMPLAKILSDMATYFQKHTTTLKIIIGLFGAWKIATVTLAMAQANATIGLYAMAAGNTAVSVSARAANIGMGLIVAVLIALAVKALMMSSPSKLVLAMFALAAAIFALSRVSDTSAASIQRMVIPLMQVGVALALVTGGLALMATAFSLLSVEQMVGMGATLITIGVGAYFLAPALTALGAAVSNPIVAGGMLIFGATVLMIGGGIGIAATGIGLMAAGFAKLFEVIDLKKLLAVGAFIGAIAVGAPAMFVAAIGLSAMGVGFAAMSVGLLLLSSKKLASVALFTSSLAQLEIAHFKELADTIRAVADAMDDLPVRNAMQLSFTMNATKIAADAIAAMNRTAPASSRQAAGTEQTGTTRGEIAQVTVNLQLDSKVLEKKVISIHKTQSGIEARDALLGTA